MNMQAMLKQAQKLQKDMIETQKRINETIFTGSSSVVTAKLNGKKEIVDLKIDLEKLDAEDIELLQDMIIVAINDAIKQIDKETEEKLGAYTQGMPGLF